MEAYPHLRIDREQPVNEKRAGGRLIIKPPADVHAHASSLRQSLIAARTAVTEDIGGFDDRPLFKLKVGSLTPEQIEQGFPGVQVLSQEDGGYALAFANAEALAQFETRLLSLADGRATPYKNVLYALEAFDRWTPEDRKGWALKRDGLPVARDFMLDIELWPLGRRDERDAMVASFERWLKQAGIDTLDRINAEELIAYRLRLDGGQAEQILNHRDVRAVDLPPSIGLELDVLRLDIQDIAPIPSPPENAPLLAVLDSGIAGGHPLVGPALGDAQGFVLPAKDSHDDEGHGTHVAGIALYGDVEECAQARSFVPLIRILSGRVLDHRADADPRFIENTVEDAVRYFHEHYRCRVFNLSYGDLNKPYLGGEDTWSCLYA